MARHVRPARDGGFTFIHDQRTYGQAQFVHLSDEHTLAYLRAIACPVLRIQMHADPISLFSARFKFKVPRDALDKYLARAAAIRDLTEAVVEGGHHVHSDRPDATAAVIVEWLRAGAPVSRVDRAPTAPRRGRFDVSEALEQAAVSVGVVDGDDPRAAAAGPGKRRQPQPQPQPRGQAQAQAKRGAVDAEAKL